MSISPTPLSVPTPSFLTLPSKPNFPISYTFIPSTQNNNQNLIVFLNGLGLPASSWLPALNLLITKHATHPAILTYDRFGQGLTTSHDPLDGTPGRQKGHTFEDVVKDLEDLLKVVVSKHMGVGDNTEEVRLLMIGASIGVPILRLYAQSTTRPSPLSGALFLDSNIANTAYSTILPHPDTTAFMDHTEKYLGDDCTLGDYTKSRGVLVGMFDFDVPNREGLDRSGCPELLPRADGPGLEGEVELTVVGHDRYVFVEVSWEKIGVNRRVSRVIDEYVPLFYIEIGLTLVESPQNNYSCINLVSGKPTTKT